jgi:RNA polymerase sigma factor (sigma-70 family)
MASQSKSESGSVSHWLEGLKAGDAQAATPLWNRYFEQLIALVRRRLRGTPAEANSEDVAARALETFFRRTQQGRFPEVCDRNQLWQLLITIAERKAVSELRRQSRQKRGAARVQNETELYRPGQSSQGAPLDQFPSPEPTPELAAHMTETVRMLLDKLDADLQQIALLKLAAYTNDEIACRIERSTPTVERRLRLIRTIWAQELVS